MLLFWLLFSSLSVVAGKSVTQDLIDCPISIYGWKSDFITVSLEKDGIFIQMPPTKLLKYFNGRKPNMIEIRVKLQLDSFKLFYSTIPPTKIGKPHENYFKYHKGGCLFFLTFFDNRKRPQAFFYFYQIGPYSLLSFYAQSDKKTKLMDCDLEVLVRGRPQAQMKCEDTRWVDVTGCQNKGFEVTKVSIDEMIGKCREFRGCNDDNSFALEEKCEENCDGKGNCVEKGLSCSVVASMAIDDTNRVARVRDYCSYTLLSAGKSQVLASFNFYEGTRTAFLDRLELELDKTKVTLKGPRLYVNDVRMNLESKQQDVKGLEIFLDEKGVNLKTKFGNGHLSIVYNEMMVYITAPANEKNLGICAGRQRYVLKKNRRMDKSDPSCRQTFNNKRQRIDCTEQRKLCKAFAKDPRMATVCTRLLCEYGNKDELLCNLDTVYKLRNGESTTGLNLTNTDCVCRNYACADHEFCAVKDGEPKCHCHAPFLHQFIQSGRYGEETTCENDTASVQLPMCLVAYRGFEESQLHLLDKDCKGQLDNVTHMINFKFDHTETCGAKIWNNDSHIIYANTVTSSDDESADITRLDNVQVNFSCSAKHPQSRIMFIEIEDNSMEYQFSMGDFQYILKQKVCIEYPCEVPLKPGDEQKLGKDMFVFMDVDNLDPSLTLVIESCVGSINPKGKAERRHKLITNGCADPGDKTVTMMENGDGETAIFCFKAFRFVGSPNKVHLNCRVRLCMKEGNDHCHPKCGKKGARHRRSVAAVGTEIVTSLSWTYQGRDD